MRAVVGWLGGCKSPNDAQRQQHLVLIFFLQLLFVHHYLFRRLLLIYVSKKTVHSGSFDFSTNRYLTVIAKRCFRRIAVKDGQMTGINGETMSQEKGRSQRVDNNQ